MLAAAVRPQAGGSDGQGQADVIVHCVGPWFATPPAQIGGGGLGGAGGGGTGGLRGGVIVDY